ncbi:hypothetical protein VZT92_011211 [Zoarces viviparus]|uniref:Uncharacterized protein n=1 Tax=Zoarces viviparus TaxID=48416 RepID=A0AAW1FBQ0_ZOAVI
MVPGRYSAHWRCGGNAAPLQGTCNCSQWLVGGAVGLVWTTPSERGGAASGGKVATRCASPPSEQSLTHISDPLPRRGSTERDALCQVLSSALGDARSGAQTGCLPTNTQPLHSGAAFICCVFFFAVRCNGSLCGIKTAFIHKQRRKRNKDSRRGGTGAASGRGGVDGNTQKI